VRDGEPLSTIGEQWLESFEKQGSAYRTVFDAAFIRRFMRSPYVQLPSRYAALGDGKTVLEAGCGAGKFSLCFAIAGCHAIALDLSPEITRNVADFRRQAANVWGKLAMGIVRGNIEFLNFADNSFDMTFNEGVVEHWLNDTERLAVLAEMTRVTKHGGTVCIIVPNGRHPFLPFWMKHMPAYQVTPPMTDYTTGRLANDLAKSGLSQIETDGIYPWHSVDQFPDYRALKLAGGLLQRTLPLPRRLREHWGVNIIAMGRKL
jgi:SAM-dependent methyltransferase